MGVSKDNKRKGAQTTPPGTKGRGKMKVGFIRPDGTWSGRRKIVRES